MLRIIYSIKSQIIPHKCTYIQYQSLENWEILQDIMRCNSSFHGQPRYDCVIINTEPISYVQFCFVFRCILESGPQDIALVHRFKSSGWKPKTFWKNCQVFERHDYKFVSLKYCVRACQMISTFEPKSSRCYLNDIIDSDMFLHCRN
jgi:hypothetical protein